MDRAALVEEWFDLTRVRMPALAGSRDWPVHLDHCFQRILLDNAVGGKWNESLPAPAYRNAPEQVLRQATELGKAVVAGKEDLAALNRNSLEWRGKI